MEINIFLLLIVIFLLFVIYIYFKYIKMRRLKASFNLYKVRDDLVYLLASEVVTETDPVFSYYYKRVNTILSMSPNVGMDDILHAMFNSSDNIDRTLDKSKRNIDRILAHDSAKKEEVRKVIENYYSGINLMILCHSSFLRIIYLLAKQFNPFRIFIEKIIPENSSYNGAYKVAWFAEKEAHKIHKYAH